MYNFDAIIDRRNTACVKYDNLANVFGLTDILPMWVATKLEDRKYGSKITMEYEDDRR